MSEDAKDEAPDLPAEDGAEAPSVERSQRSLLDRFLYKGVLPGYAFPTDVVAFHVFDENNSEPMHTEFLYTPSQGLPVALSQYAPGKVVWVDNKEWTSGAIYSQFRNEMSEAWRDRWLYFECAICHYALHVPYDKAERGEKRPCPACGTPDAFGAAMNWMRPPGFAHPVKKPPGTSPDDAPARSYATRAKLSAEGPADASKWSHLTPRLEQTYRRDTLLVTNTGPRGEGYSYCTICGLIEPTATASGVVASTHKKPYPDEKQEECPGGRSTRGLVLGTDFISDVLLIRVKADAPVTLRPQFLSTQVVLRTLADVLAIEATQQLDLESSEILAEYRPALTTRGNEGREAEIYLYDTLPGGAGFTKRVFEFGLPFFESVLKRLEGCPANCDESCYRCLRSFGNRFEHTLLNRHLGASFLRYLLYDIVPTTDAATLERSTDMLFADLQSRGLDGIGRNEEVEVEGIGTVVAPILVTRDDQRWIFGVHGPLTTDHAPTPELADAKEYGSIPVRLIDEMIIARNLPFASGEVLKWLT